MPRQTPSHPKPPNGLQEQLLYLRLNFFHENYAELARLAAEKSWSHLDFLSKLIDGEAQQRQDHARQRRTRAARFPVLKSLQQFDFTWPAKINRLQIQNLFRLQFIEEKANVIFLGGVGLGKSHLGVALGHAACQAGYRVLFSTAIESINALSVAHSAGRFAAELRKYRKPDLLILDELGYLPIDKKGAELLFQILSQRYERGAIVLTTNKAFKHWPAIFNNDSTLASAVLDRLLHHAETVVIEGKSYRMKDRIEPKD